MFVRPTMQLVTTQQQRALFGATVRKLRLDKRWSQRDLAERVNVPDSTVAAWEQGGGAREHNVRALEAVFDLEPGDLGHLLGQAPPPTIQSPEDAIKADIGIPAEHRRTLLAHLAEIRRLEAEADETS